ncbi:MAG: helix-turn-helix transcriptional regulator [Prevotella sp.]|nr:helix-turn-helix transcriptional regulator [Prevotella sp.]
MKIKGVTLEALAQNLGVTSSTMNIKLGGNITLNALYDIAQALDCEIADFFPVPLGYKYWTQECEKKETGKGTYFCPKCGTKFQVND